MRRGRMEKTIQGTPGHSPNIKRETAAEEWCWCCWRSQICWDCLMPRLWELDWGVGGGWVRGWVGVWDDGWGRGWDCGWGGGWDGGWDGSWDELREVVYRIVCSFLGRPWHRGAVLITCSVSELCGAGAVGRVMAFLRILTKWDETWECVSSWNIVDGWARGFDEDGLFYTSFDSVIIIGNGDVVFSEVMFLCML